MSKTFDVVIGNPPYQKPKNIAGGKKKGTIGGDIWSKFAEIGLDLCKDNGHIALIHPPMWRKPEHRIWRLLTKYNIKHLEIHSESDGQKTFNASTKYDWYVIQKSHISHTTNVRDELGDKHEIDLSQWKFLPNYNYDAFKKLLATDNESRCEVLYDASSHTQRKGLMSNTENATFKYPCIHGLQQNNGITYWYSSDNTKGFFGVPKVILTWGRHQYPLIDFDGKYGMTQVVFGLKVDSIEEADGIKKAVESDKFKKIIASSKWSPFQTEWRMFKYFKKEFWKEFI